MKSPEDRSYFFDAGLRFSCTQCGKCCTGEPGIVRATPTEIARIEKLTGRRLVLTKTVDPAVLGGVRVTMGDRVIDGTVRTNLDKLRAQLFRTNVR